MLIGSFNDCNVKQQTNMSHKHLKQITNSNYVGLQVKKIVFQLKRGN